MLHIHETMFRRLLSPKLGTNLGTADPSHQNEWETAEMFLTTSVAQLQNALSGLVNGSAEKRANDAGHLQC